MFLSSHRKIKILSYCPITCRFNYIPVVSLASFLLHLVLKIPQSEIFLVQKPPGFVWTDYMKHQPFQHIKKKEVHNLFYSIAEKLGHKRFIKKENTWRENYTVTINHYVQPEILKQVKSVLT